MVLWCCFSCIWQLTKIVFLADFHGDHILKKNSQSRIWQKIFVPILPLRSTLLDLDCEIVTVLNAGIFPRLRDDRTFKMRIHEDFQHGVLVWTKKRALCIIFNMLLISSFFFGLSKEHIWKKMNEFDRKWMEMTLFMVQPQRYYFIRNSIF